MKVFYLGATPKNYPFDLDWRRWGEGPIYEVDGLILFETERPLLEMDLEKVRLAAAHGRALLYFGDATYEGLVPAESAFSEFDPTKIDNYLLKLGSRPRSNYQPIDCNFYDNFEAAITQRRAVKIEFREVDGSSSRIETRLLDTKTHLTEEFVQFRDGTWLRLDRVVSVDGIPAGASCSF